MTFPRRWDRISLRRSVFHRDCIVPKATEYAVSSTFPCRLATNRSDWLGYSDARGDTTTATWPEKVVTEAIDHRMLNWLNKRFAIASQQTSVYVALLLLNKITFIWNEFNREILNLINTGAKSSIKIICPGSVCVKSFCVQGKLTRFW